MTALTSAAPPAAVAPALRAGATRPARRVLPGFRLTLGYTVLYLSLIVLIPVSALFFKTFTLTWEQFWLAVSSQRVQASYRLTFGASFLAALVNLVFGLLLAWVLALVVGALWVERYRVVHVATFPARALGGVDVGRDWSLGCALTILLSPLIGLLYLLLARGRVVRVAGPFAADEAGIVGLRLKGSEAEGRTLEQVLLGARMAG